MFKPSSPKFASSTPRVKQAWGIVRLATESAICVFVLVVATIFTSSCQKDQIIKPVLSDKNSTSTIQSDSSKLNLEIEFNSTLPIKESKGNSIMSATSYNDISSQMFPFYNIYRYSYQHLKQPDKVSCSWTSYVLATGCVAQANNYWYPVTYEQISKVRAGCKGSADITKIKNYGIINDKKFVNFVPGSNGNRLEFVKGILNHINIYHSPFMAITSIGTTGHYVVVFAIDWKKGLKGSTIYYMDPNEEDLYWFYGNLKKMDLSKFLDSMICEPYTSCYNALFIRPN